MSIQEAKAATCDVGPGRRPRGPALTQLVQDYRRRAGTDRATDESAAGGNVRANPRDSAAAAAAAGRTEDPDATTGTPT